MSQRGFVLPSFLLSPTGIMGVLIVALSLSNVLFYKLWQGEVHEYADFKSTVEKESELLRIENERVRAESEQITKDVSNSWSNALDHLRRNPPIRVRSDCNQANLRPVPGTPGLVASPQIGGGESGTDISVETCEQIANDSLLDDKWIGLVKEWVKKQHEVRK